jgi:HPr kinase/phosphorylase
MPPSGDAAGEDGGASSWAGVLLLGPPGSGKSDLALRLIDRGFALVADDRVDIDAGFAAAPAALAGLIEVRGLGIVRLPYLPRARLALAVTLGESPARLPAPARASAFNLPEITVDAAAASAPQRVALALDCLAGTVPMRVGAFVSAGSPQS